MQWSLREQEQSIRQCDDFLVVANKTKMGCFKFNIIVKLIVGHNWDKNLHRAVCLCVLIINK